MASRAFPAFVYDPGAGAEWARRFRLLGNPQTERTWPVHELVYADDTLQRVTEELPFTFADFVVGDPRHEGHFARVPRERWNGSLTPVGAWLSGGPGGSESVPSVAAIDEAGQLQRLVVDERLIDAARRCAAEWSRLQELDRLGHPSVAPAAAAPVPDRERELAAAASVPAPAASAAGVATLPAVDAAPVAAPSADEPYIETPRCTTCNECTLMNNRMFAYNENKQAYVKDPKAGSYRELVEAAESCQVAIIHPGAPRDPTEAGLKELIERAAPFR